MASRAHDLQRIRALQQRQRHQADGEHDPARGDDRADFLRSETSASTSRSPRSSPPPIRSAPSMPPGIQPPVIMRFAASSVPVIQLALTSASESPPCRRFTITPNIGFARRSLRSRDRRCPRRTAARRGRSWSISTSMRSRVLRADAARRHQRDHRAESRCAFRSRQDRKLRRSDTAERLSGSHREHSTKCRSRWCTAARS